MSHKNYINPLELEISNSASLKQAVEWVAFGEPPLTAPYDVVFRTEDGIWLRNRDPESQRTQAICDAQGKLFTALQKGALSATAYAVDEIEIANYDSDTPDFRPVKATSTKKKYSKSQVIDNSLWDYNSIFWSDSSLIYNRKKLSRNMWSLARFIRVETSKLFELFPKKDECHDQRSDKTHTGDPGRPSSAHLYMQKFEQLVKEKEIEATLAKQARVLRNWFISNHPNLAPPREGTIENRIRDLYNKAKNPTK